MASEQQQQQRTACRHQRSRHDPEAAEVHHDERPLRPIGHCHLEPVNRGDVAKRDHLGGYLSPKLRMPVSIELCMRT